MTERLTWPEFARLAADYSVVPVGREFVADTETPVGVFQRIGGATGSVLWERVEAGERWGRYSFIGLDPVTTLLLHDGVVSWTDGPICPVPAGGSLTETMRAIRRQLRAPQLAGLPGWSPGAVCVLGADALRAAGGPADRTAEPAGQSGDPPDSAVIFPGAMIVFDHFRQRMRLVVNVFVGRGRSLRGQYDAASSRLDELAARLTTGARVAARVAPAVVADPGFDSELADPQFQVMIEAAHRRVRAGEVRQVNISRRFAAAAPTDPLEVYRVLRTTNPSPYLYLMRLPGATMVGSSPQGLLQVRDRQLTTYVLAGTRPRGADPETDAGREAELVGDAKERAEHGMLVDLALADLAPVARPGSVQVTQREQVVRYSRVMHLTSEITGELADGQDALAALEAVFPAGTVSGVPRAAALKVIDELEPRRRGLYGGAVGLLDFAGGLDVCIGVRALQFFGGAAYCQAAAAVVAGSVPELEVAESRHKARALFVALATAASAAPAS